MDFSVIRPKRPINIPPPAPAAAPSPSPAPPSGGPQNAPPPLDKPPQPSRVPSHPFMVPNMEELDHLGRMHRVRSIDCTNTKTWRMNFGDHYPHDYHDNNYFSNGYNNRYYHDYNRPRFEGQYRHNGPFQRMAIPPPPPDYRQPALHGPYLALPPPEYLRGPQSMLGLHPPQDFHYPPPRDVYYGGYGGGYGGGY